MGAMIWWNAAMSMQMLVRGYLAFQLTGDFRALGIVGLGSAIPMLLLSPFGGVIADRTSKRFVLQIGQAFSMVTAIVVAILLFAGVLQFWHLFAASVAQGLMMSLVMPSRQAFLPEVVGLKRLMNAIPLQSAGMNLMQIMAPTLGGFMIDWIGPEFVYSAMSFMYAMSVVMLFRVKSMTIEEQEAARAGAVGAGPRGSMGGRGVGGRRLVGGPRPNVLSELKDGVIYMFADRKVLVILSFAFLGSLLGMPIRMLLPGYVAEVFGDSGSTLGLLQMGMGTGALGGALVLATLRMDRHRGLLLAGSSVVMGVAMIGFSATGVFIVGWFGLLVIGIGSAGRQALSQVLVQEYVQEEYRGRVMSLFMMQFSLMSVGTFLVSLYMERVGPEFAIGSLGVVLIAATFIYLLLVPRFRHIA
jgi:MFS family permease